LEGTRSQIQTLKKQVDVFADLKHLADGVHFACRFGSSSQKRKGYEDCLKFWDLFEHLDNKTGQGSWGLPPLTDYYVQLFKEDGCDVFLEAAQAEIDLASGANQETRDAADRKAINWLNRAEQILPGTRALYVRRAPSWGRLGNKEADRADMDKARSIKPTSAV